MPSDALAFHVGTGDFSNGLFTLSSAAHSITSTPGSYASRLRELEGIDENPMSPIPVLPLLKTTFLA
jgi:hypothetical protein